MFAAGLLSWERIGAGVTLATLTQPITQARAWQGRCLLPAACCQAIAAPGVPFGSSCSAAGRLFQRGDRAGHAGAGRGAVGGTGLVPGQGGVRAACVCWWWWWAGDSPGQGVVGRNSRLAPHMQLRLHGCWQPPRSTCSPAIPHPPSCRAHCHAAPPGSACRSCPPTAASSCPPGSWWHPGFGGARHRGRA